MLNISKKIGTQTEKFACHYLKTQGLSLVTRNYACRFGEIDLIMQDKESLVFIEVRFRRDSRFGHSIETVDTVKQNKLIKTAEYYLQYHSLLDAISCRFDVLGVSPSTKPKKWFEKRNTSQYYSAQVEWVKNAFSR